MEEARQAELLKAIRAEVSAGIALLPPHLRAWAQAHTVEPREIRAALDADGKTWSKFMLVTDDVGHADGSCRVVYDPIAQTFGTVTQVKDAPLWYLGSDGTFDAAVANMRSGTLTICRPSNNRLQATVGGLGGAGPVRWADDIEHAYRGW